MHILRVWGFRASIARSSTCSTAGRTSSGRSWTTASAASGLSSGIYGRDVAGYHELRRLGRSAAAQIRLLVAPSFRSVFLHLKAEINWYRLFRELICGFDVKAVEKRQARR